MSTEDIKCAQKKKKKKKKQKKKKEKKKKKKRLSGHEISYNWAILLMYYLMREVNSK